MQTTEHYTGIIRQYPASESIMNCSWLFKNFLQHKMSKPFFVNLPDFKIYFFDFRLYTIRYCIVLRISSSFLIIARSSSFR